MKRGEFLFLGTGGSAGVPMIGCTCAVCTSPSAYNQRWRTAGLVRVAGQTFLIDAGPEFRLQALRYQITHIDAVLLTHAHFDHIAGIDDLRAYFFLQHKPLPCLLSQATFEEVRQRYHYLFEERQKGKSLSAQLDFHILEKRQGETTCVGVPITYFSYAQGGVQVTGFRFGTFAYVSDIREYDESLFDSLRGVETLVLSALRHTTSPMHFNLEEAIAFARRVGAKKTYLTHVAHDLEYAETNALLPEGVELSYDGLKISFA